MKPTKQEIESAIGEELADDLPIEELYVLPSPQDELEGGFILKYVGKINNQWEAFKKTRNGKIIALLLTISSIHSLIEKGCDFTLYAYNVSVTSLTKIESYVSEWKIADCQEPANGYLVMIPKESNLQIPSSLQHNYPIGTTFAPASSITQSYLG